MADEPIQASPAPDNPDPNADLEKRLSEVERRYSESSREGQRLAQENNLLRQQMLAAQPAPAVDAYQELETIGIPSRTLREVVRREAQEALNPVVNLIQGSVNSRNHMMANYGQDYTKFESDVMAHVEADPALKDRYARLFAADPVGAAEYAFLQFGEHKRRTNPVDTTSQERREAEGSQARVPLSRQSEGRREGSRPNARLQGLWERYQHNPSRANAESFLTARLGQSIPDEHLNS
jgi:hypothetical protein